MSDELLDVVLDASALVAYGHGLRSANELVGAVAEDGLIHVPALAALVAHSRCGNEQRRVIDALVRLPMVEFHPLTYASAAQVGAFCGDGGNVGSAAVFHATLLAVLVGCKIASAEAKLYDRLHPLIRDPDRVLDLNAGWDDIPGVDGLGNF